VEIRWRNLRANLAGEGNLYSSANTIPIKLGFLLNFLGALVATRNASLYSIYRPLPPRDYTRYSQRLLDGIIADFSATAAFNGGLGESVPALRELRDPRTGFLGDLESKSEIPAAVRSA